MIFLTRFKWLAFGAVIMSAHAFAEPSIELPTLTVCRHTDIEAKGIKVHTANGILTFNTLDAHCTPPAYGSGNTEVDIAPPSTMGPHLTMATRMVTSTDKGSPIGYFTGYCTRPGETDPYLGCRFRITVVINEQGIVKGDPKVPDFLVMEIMDGSGNIVWSGGGIVQGTIYVNGKH